MSLDFPNFEIADANKQEHDANIAMLGDTWAPPQAALKPAELAAVPSGNPTDAVGQKIIESLKPAELAGVPSGKQSEAVGDNKIGDTSFPGRGSPSEYYKFPELDRRADNLEGFSASEKKFVKKVQDLLLDGNLDGLKKALAEEFKGFPEGLGKLVKGLQQTLEGTGVSAEILPGDKGSGPRLQISVDRRDTHMKVTLDPQSAKSPRAEDGQAIAGHLKEGIAELPDDRLKIIKPPRFPQFDEIHIQQNQGKSLAG